VDKYGQESISWLARAKTIFESVQVKRIMIIFYTKVWLHSQALQGKDNVKNIPRIIAESMGKIPVTVNKLWKPRRPSELPKMVGFT
jgi:hypothetical protein